MYEEISRNKRVTWLIIIVFILMVLFVGYVYGQLTDYGYFGLVIALFLALPTALIGYYTSDQMVLAMAGASLVEKRDNPRLYNLVENLAIASGLPTPKIYIINDQAMNAFATGRDPNHAVIAVTAGLLNNLSKTELEGVIAHEFSHIKNYDTRLSTIVVIFVGLIAILADIFWRGGFRGRRNSEKSGGGLLALVGIIFIIISPIVAKLMQLALSRNREFLADSDAALLTRYPQGLIGALEKISNQSQMLSRSNNAMNHLYIISPIDSLAGKRQGSWWNNLFSTHPPTAERIRRLENMGK